jgi:hypothetical protein
MVKRFASVGVVCFAALTAGSAVCQDAGRSLPDAPSVQAANKSHYSYAFLQGARFAVKPGAMGGDAGMMRPGEFAFVDRTASSGRDPNAIFRKYLNPSSARPQASRAANGSSVAGRATFAASRPLIAHDYSGKAKLNTSYLLRTLTSVAKDTASTPYWRRSLGAPFGDFGSTVGSDAGTNLWHEFEPSIGHFMKNHTPAFVSRMEVRIGRK